MTLLPRLAATALSLWFLAVLCCPGRATFFSPSHSLFLDAFEVIDIRDTRLGGLHESAHMCPWILVAYSGGCGHCRLSAPDISRLAKETTEDSGDVLNEVTVAALNCETSTEECRRLQVHAVPSLYLLLPFNMSTKESTLAPVIANKKDVDEGVAEARPITMARVLLGQGGYIKEHFDTARKVWGSASASLWAATSKERCLHMRSYLRNLKVSDAAEAGAGVGPSAAGATKFVEDTTFHMVDIANAFLETLYHEVALIGLESAARRRALLQFLRVVQQRLPGLGADVLLYSMTANRSVDNMQYSVDDFAFVSVADWQKLVLSAGIPYQGTPRHLRWKTCKGSSWRYRGFPCGMWLLYHALTVNVVHADADNNNAEVLFIILDYARNFFSCDACRTHFLRFQPEKDKDPVLQLWRFHNEVNRRLAEVKEGADPLVRKRIFPGPRQCPACYRDAATSNDEERFVVTEVSKYLRSRYKWVPTALYETTGTETLSLTRRAANHHGEAITAYRDPFSMNAFLTIVFPVMVVVLGMIYVLRRARTSGTKRRRPILPLRAQV
ncbi:Thioredoxin/Erv1 / Alr family, putative [Leishmania lindenbergi]|uniref:Sulfhydryl oxidase n=1 Tax=Leishmania lindenbergi TaxID=651832 RepID=A0AAW3A2W4_9TRYP